MAERTVTVDVRMRLASFIASAKQGKKAITDFRDETRKLAAEGKFKQFADGAALGALGVTVALGAVIKVTAEFEAAMSKVGAATNATGEQLESLRQAALDAGRTTAFSATEAAGAITELAKAGIAASDILNGGLAGALDLAAAGELSVAEAAEVAATAMVQFKLDGAAVPHIADLLAAAAGKAQGDVHEMAQALSQGGLVAAQMGLTIEETTGTLASFAAAGLRGSDAGTSLKTMLLRLAAPAGEAADLMKSLGIQAYDAEGRFVGLQALAGQLQTSLGGLTQAQRDSALATIFGSDAIRAANVLYQQGSKGIEEWTGKVNDSGYAQEQAAKKMDNLLGDLKKFRGALETTFIEAGTGANSVLRDFVQVLTDVVNAIGSIPGPILEVLVWTAALGAGATLLTAGWLRVVETFAAARIALEGMGRAGGMAAKGLEMIGPLTARLGALAVVLVASGTAATLLGDAFASLLWGAPPDVIAVSVDSLVRSLEELATTGNAAGKLTDIFGQDLAGIRIAAESMGEMADSAARLQGKLDSMNGAVRTAMQGVNVYGSAIYEAANAQNVEYFNKLDQALTQLANNGGPHQAAFANLAAQANAQGLSTSALLALLPQYTAASAGAAIANQGLAKGFGTVDGNTKIMTESLCEALAAGRSLEDLLNELHGAAMQFAGAEISAEEAIDRFQAAIDASNGSMNIHNEVGREAKSAMLDMVDAAIAAAQAKYEETGSTEDAVRVYEDYIGQLKAAMLAAGMNEKEVEKLLRSYAALPESVFTDITSTAKPADVWIREYLSHLRGIPRNITTYIHLKYMNDKEGRILQEEEFADGGIAYFADGSEDHRGMISRGNQLRVWSEPETMGEAYIPLAPSKRGRSEQIWAEVGRRFGMFQAPVAATASTGPSIDPRLIERAIRDGLRGAQVVMDGRAVGAVQGRQSDLYTRAGG